MDEKKKEPNLEALSGLFRECLVLPALEASDDLLAQFEDFKDFYLLALPGALADLERDVNPQSLRNLRGWQRAVARQREYLEPVVRDQALRALEVDQVLGRRGLGLTTREVAAALTAGGLDVGRGMCLEVLKHLAGERWLERRRDRFLLAEGARERLQMRWAPEALFGVLLGLPRTLTQRARAVPGSRLAFVATMLTPGDLTAFMRELRGRVIGQLEAFGVPRSLVPPGEAHRFTGLRAGALSGPARSRLRWRRPASPAVKALMATVGGHLGVQIGTLDQAVAAMQRMAVVHLYRVYEAGRQPSDHVEQFFAERYNIRKHDTLMGWRNGPMPKEGESEPVPLNGGFVGEALREILKFLTRLSGEVVSESRIRAHVRETCSSGAAQVDAVTVALQRLIQDGSVIRVSARARQQGEAGYQSQTRGIVMPPEEFSRYLGTMRMYLAGVPGLVEAFLDPSPFSHALLEERMVLRHEVERVADALLAITQQLVEEYNRPYASMSEAEVKALGGQAFTLLFQCHQQPIIPHEDLIS